MKNVSSRTKTRLADEHLEERMRIARTEISPYTERLLKQNQQLQNTSLTTGFVK